MNGVSPAVAKGGGEVKPFSLAIAKEQQDDVVKVFTKKKDERILVRKVMLHKGIGMILMLK